MRPYVLIAAALAACAPATAFAAPQPAEEPCHAFYTNHPAVSPPGRVEGVLYGQPVTVVEDGLPAARLVCSVQLDAVAHSAADVVTVPGEWATGVVAVAPARVGWDGTTRDNIVVCSHVEVAGGAAYYWNGATATWSTDPDAPCV